jgi:hypothetical protein
MDISTLDKIFEAHLDSSLNPVQPDPEFILRLRRRLSNNPSVILEPRSSATIFVLVALGLFVGVLLTWLLRRFR